MHSLPATVFLAQVRQISSPIDRCALLVGRVAELVAVDEWIE